MTYADEHDNGMQVVWRNPEPPFPVRRTVQLVGTAAESSLYLVIGAFSKSVFEVTPGLNAGLQSQSDLPEVWEQWG